MATDALTHLRKTPTEFRNWLLEQVDFLTDAETDAQRNPGFDAGVFVEDCADILHEASEFAVRLGRPDLVEACRKGADLRVVLAKCIAACDEMIGQPSSAAPATATTAPATTEQSESRPPLKAHYALAYEQYEQAKLAGHAKTDRKAWEWLWNDIGRNGSVDSMKK